MMPAPMGGQMGQPMHPMMLNQPPPPPQQPNPTHQSTELKFDNVAKVKTLIWSLKETLAMVMRVAGANVYHSASGKTSEDKLPRIDKTMEEFFSICNQIELNLKIIRECTLQQKDSAQHLPLPVTLGKNEVTGTSVQDGLSYMQYLTTTKGQVNFAKSVQEMLTEGARKITHTD